MREGINPAKLQKTLPAFGRHRVLLPVYIPNREGYFAEAIEILRLCLDSLHLSAGGKAAITVISNGCIPEAVEVLQWYLAQGKLDQLVLNQGNRGKVDALAAALRGCHEELLTISDSDVLFKPGWLEAVEQIYAHFPEAGMVSPVPSPGAEWTFASATLLSALLTGEIAFEKIVPDADLDRFAASIGRPDLYSPEHRAVQTLLRRGDFKACLGCGHFVATLRRELVASMPAQAALQTAGGSGMDAEQRWFDAPGNSLGVFRLAATRAYAYHMGNRVESWMSEELAHWTRQPSAAPDRPERIPQLRRGVVARLPVYFRERLVQGLRKTGVMRRFFQWRGRPAGLPLP